MCSSSFITHDKRLTKFAELLVHDYLRAKGFEATGAKFIEECANLEKQSGDTTPDDASSWYIFSEKLGLPVRDRVREGVSKIFAQ